MVERAANTLAKAEADGDNPSPAFVRAFVSKVTTTNHLNKPIPCNTSVWKQQLTSCTRSAHGVAVSWIKVKIVLRPMHSESKDKPSGVPVADA